MEENNIEKQGGLSASHLRELEAVISQILTNQEIIIEQNRELLAAKKAAKIWGIIKIGLFLLLTFGSILFMPAMIKSLTNQVTSNINVGDVAKNSGLNIDANQLSELEQLLK